MRSRPDATERTSPKPVQGREMVGGGYLWVMALAMVLGLAIGHRSMYGAQAALFANLYPVNVRYTGLSMTQQVGATLGGGLAPLAGSALLAAEGGGRSLLVVYAIGIALISSLAATGLKSGEARYVPTTSEPGRAL